MSKKKIRKALQLDVIKGIEKILKKYNGKTIPKITKVTNKVSKIIAKKFYKLVNPSGEIQNLIISKTSKKPIKKAVRLRKAKSKK